MSASQLAPPTASTLMLRLAVMAGTRLSQTTHPLQLRAWHFPLSPSLLPPVMTVCPLSQAARLLCLRRRQ